MSAETTSSTFRRRMVDLRKSLGLNQFQVAERMTGLGMPAGNATVSKIEHGTRKIDLDELSIVAQALNTTVVDLVADWHEVEGSGHADGFAAGFSAGRESAFAQIELRVHALRTIEAAS